MIVRGCMLRDRFIERTILFFRVFCFVVGRIMLSGPFGLRFVWVDIDSFAMDVTEFSRYRVYFYFGDHDL